MKHTERLNRFFNEIAMKHNYENCTVEVNAISSGGANYTSELYAATISSLNKDDLHLFAKVAAMTEESRAAMPGSMFDIEDFVYSELAEKFKQIEDKHQIPEEDRFVFCKHYGSNLKLYEETIVLENLAAKGFVVHDRLKSVDWPYASKAVESLAKFHALAMAYGENNPEKLKEMSESFVQYESNFRDMVVTLRKLGEMAVKVTEAEYKERLAKFIEGDVNCDPLHYIKPRRKAVLLHGDYRPSNIMHRLNEDGSIAIVPVDFQITRPGCMVTDLLYFIFTSTDKEFRAQHYEQLVELYYERLSRSLRALHFDPEELYSREDFQAELKEILPYGLLVAIMVLPVVTVDSENAPDVHENSLFENLAKTKTSALYPERMNGVVEDYVRWGVI